jgi:hypothetical protein
MKGKSNNSSITFLVYHEGRLLDFGNKPKYTLGVSLNATLFEKQHN